MAVEFVAAGAFTGSADGLTVTWPGSQSSGDLALLIVESGYSDTVSASGWTEVSGSPQSSSANNHKLNAFYKIVGSSESSVSIADPGNHGAAQILVFSGVDNTTPINVSAGSLGTVGTSITVPAVTTTVDNCAIIHIAGTGHDTNATDDFSGWTNANLASITEISDNVTGVAGGGGFGIAWGILASTGSSGTCAVTQASNIIWSGITIALAPASEGGGTTTSNAPSGSFTVTGSSSTGTRSLSSSASSGAFTITGTSSTGTRALLSQASPGSYTITGAASSGSYIHVGSTTSNATPGAYTLTGSASAGVRSLLSNAAVGSIVITGYAASAIKAVISNATPGSYTITGTETSDTWQHVSNASPGAWTITGYPLTGALLGEGVTLSPEDIAAIADAVWAHATAVDFTGKMLICSRILRNKTVTDPTNGVMTVYADDGVTPYLTAQLHEDVAETQTYRGQGAEVRGRLS